MRFFSICSSPTKGNSYFIQTDATQIIIDVGFTKTLLNQTLYQKNIKVENLSGVFLTHSHLSHIKGLKFLLDLNPNIPVYASEDTFNELEFKNIKNKVFIKEREIVKIHDLSIFPFPVKHSVKNLNFTFQFNNEKLALITNTGNIDKTLIDDIGKCQHFLIESYYHPGLIRKHSSWEEIKRIVTTEGHLTNEDASEIIARCYNPSIKNIILCNLSKFNQPTLAKLLIESIFTPEEHVNIEVAPHDFASRWFESNIEASLIEIILKLPKEQQETIVKKVLEEF